MKDPYKILGVDKTSTANDIKKAYRKLAKEYHPDKSKGNEERFKEIADAYETLSNSTKRSQYDQAANNPFGKFEEGFFEDFIKTGNDPGFTNMFNQRYGFNTRGSNITAQVYITLEEAYFGCSKEIRVGTRVVSIDIKNGVKPGQRMRLKGLGQRGMTESQSGDLILTVLVQDDPNFYLDQKGLHTIKHISLYDALLGGKGDVKVFDKTISYNIPKCVKNGTMLRIKGKGFPAYNNPNILGDFFVNILVDLPKQLSEEQEALVKKMKDIQDGY
tara:strand:+ start:2023 stop:2841 length:819 start_codon:yes stop_codon:yes gene_type:complete